MRDVYQHPTVRQLAAGAAGPASRPPDAPRSASRARGAGQRAATPLCGLLQLLMFLACVWPRRVRLESRAPAGSPAQPLRRPLRAVGRVRRWPPSSASCVLPIAGQVAARRAAGSRARSRSGAWRYFRFWLVKTLMRANPLVLFAGSPLYLLYLRALGAKIGRGAAICLRERPGLHRPADHRRRHGHPQGLRVHRLPRRRRPDPDRPGHHRRDVVVGEQTVLDIDTAIGDRGTARPRLVAARRPGGAGRRALARLAGRADRHRLPRRSHPRRCGTAAPSR